MALPRIPVREIFVVGLSAGLPLIGMTLLLTLAASSGPSLKEAVSPWPFAILMGVVGAGMIGTALLPSFAFCGFCGWLLRDSVPLSGGLMFGALFLGTWIGLLCGRLLKDHVDFTKLASLARANAITGRLQRLQGRSLNVVLVAIRLSPHMPFALTNLVVGRLGLSLSTSSILSVIGLLPRSILAWYVGLSIGSFSDWKEESPSLGAWGILATVLLIGLIWWLTRKARSTLSEHSVMET